MIKKLLFLFHHLRIYSFTSCYTIIGLPKCYNGKEPACQCKRCERCGFDPWVRKIPWRRKWQPTPVFLPGKSHGQRSLVGSSPQGRRVKHIQSLYVFDSVHKHRVKLSTHTYKCSLILLSFDIKFDNTI